MRGAAADCVTITIRHMDVPFRRHCISSFSLFRTENQREREREKLGKETTRYHDHDSRKSFFFSIRILQEIGWHAVTSHPVSSSASILICCDLSNSDTQRLYLFFASMFGLLTELLLRRKVYRCFSEKEIHAPCSIDFTKFGDMIEAMPTYMGNLDAGMLRDGSHERREIRIGIFVCEQHSSLIRDYLFHPVSKFNQTFRITYATWYIWLEKVMYTGGFVFRNERSQWDSHRAL